MKPQQVIGYVRVSTDEQTLSVEAQEEALRGWCQAQGVALARDTLTAAIAERMAQKTGAVILSVTGAGDGEGPEAVLMRTIIDAFAQYERTLIAMRTKTAMAHKRAMGERVDAVPYGYQLAADGVHFVAAPDEQAVIDIVRRLRAGGLSYRAIAAELNQRGLTNRAGGRFMATQVVH